MSYSDHYDSDKALADRKTAAGIACGYIAFYQGKRLEIYAPNLYAAKVKAIEAFKPPKSKAHMVSVMLAEKDGQPVTHVADF